MNRGGQFGAELGSQCEWKFTGQFNGIIQLTGQCKLLLGQIERVRVLIFLSFFLQIYAIATMPLPPNPL